MSHLSEFLKGQRGGGFDSDDLIRVCRELGLWATIDERTKGRALVTRQRTGRRDGRPRRPTRIEQEANGFVVSLGESDSPRPLAVPIRSMNHAPNAQTVNNFLARTDCPYDVTVALDGTVVTLYKWRDVWCMGSARGYDVSEYTWIGDKTFAATFAEAWASTHEGTESAVAVNLGADGRLEIEGISDDEAANHSWTLGFSHPDFHVLAKTPSVWQIQAVDLRTGRDASGTASVLGPAPAAAPAMRSMRAYREHLASDDAEFPPAFAGYVFRSRDADVTRDVSDFMIESPRMALARRLFYSRPPRDIQNALTSTTRPWYHAVSAWCRGHSAKYLTVAGEAGKRRIDQITASHGLLTSRVHAIVVRHLASGAGDSEGSPTSEDPVREMARRVEEVLLRSGQRMAPTDPKGQSIIGDLLKGNEFRLDLTFFAAKEQDAPGGAGGAGGEA